MFVNPSIVIIIIFNFFIHENGITKPNEIESKKNRSKQTALGLIKIWEGSNSKAANVNDPYTIDVWEKLLFKEYEIAIKSKDSDLQFKLSIPLSFTYHSQTKFSKGKPLLEYLYNHKEKLTDQEYEQVLIKLEEEYRGSNDMVNAIKIRKKELVVVLSIITGRFTKTVVYTKQQKRIYFNLFQSLRYIVYKDFLIIFI